MPLNNAEKCKNYRERQEEASLKLKKTPLTSAQRSRMYRLRKKKLTQGIKSTVNEVLYTSSTAKSRMASEPSLQPVTTRKHPILDFDNEKRLVKHILKLGDAGFPPNRQAIRMLAYQFAEKLRLKHNFDHENKMAGGAWFKSFIERNPELSIRQAEGLSVARAKGLSREEVNDFYDLLMKVLTENDLLDKPEKINNMDESVIQLNNKPGKVIAKKGAKVVNSVTSAEKVFKMSEDITKKNAQYCKNYHIRKKMANKGAVKLKKTNSEYCRTSRQRKKIIAQELQSENEDIHTPSTSRIQVTYASQPVTTDEECKMLNQDQELLQPDAPTVDGNYSDRLIMDHSTGTYDTITNETEDVKEETDIQANEIIEKTDITDVRNENVRNRKTSELDKFKRRMIRAIARLMYTEHRAQADIWEDLKNETGCDCELLWSRMRALTIKKLLRLFTAEDKIKNINKIVQLSVTDWLLYDLVLVHEKVDVIGQELNDKEEPAFLRDLFNLVEEFNIESAVGEDLVKKWFEATAKYNNTGKRQSSPMLLQKRWYQLKERSRSNFYNFWFEYRGDSKKLERANEFKPSDLQLDIVKRYKEIVTKPFLNWEVLIKEGRVALPEDFERLRMARNKIKISENEPDIEVIEQHVETIDLEETNDSNDTVNKDTYNNENDFNIDIVKVESLAEQDDDVSVLESVYIPLEKTEFSERNNDECDVDVEAIKCPDDNDLEIIESDLGQMVPKIASVTSTAYIESTKDGTYEELPSKDIIDIEDCETRSKSSEAVNVILEQIFKNVVENKIITNIDKKIATTSKGKVPNLEKDIDILMSNASTDLDIKELKNTDMPGNDKKSTEIEEKYDIGFDDFSNNLNFIDDGIEFEDDGIEYMDEDFVLDHKVKSEINSENIEATNEEEPKIDLKLLLTPVVYTKKLDDMDVFRFIDYNTVKDDRVLQNAARESKPVDNKSVNMKTMFEEHNQDDSCSLESDSGDVISDDGVAITSWLFRKPKVNNYNPIQLCKNPDFNTRLKRLAAAFYTSQRNRLLLKQCKPLTVDLHKTFESKLIDNTLFLNKTKNDLDIENTVNEISVISCKTEPIEPSTDNDQLTQSSTIAADQQISIEQPPEIHTERNKVINLPDIVQIRRVNQGLLVAEVSPIQVVNPVNEINTRPLKNLLNTVIEPGTTHMNSTVTDEEVIKSPNFSQLLLDTDKIVAVSESEHSKLTDTINVDIEQSETMSQQVNNYKRHTRESLLKQPITRTKTKTGTKKYMQLSWLPKPQTIRTDATDCLLAADTVERILSLCKDDYIPQNLKVYKPKRKKKAGVTDKKTTENQVSAVGKKKTIKEKNNKKETRIPKKSKCRVSIFAQTTNIKNVCCWSRQKVENFTKLNTGKHYCLHNKCVCCCKADLEAKIFAIEQQRLQSELIILSDDESIAITSAKTHLPISQVTIGTNTDYDKDFEDQFAANLNMFKDNANQVHTPIISLPLNGLPQTFSTESGSQTITPNRVVEPLPPTILDNKIPSVTSTHKNKPKVPISLGRNKILLCSFKPTTGTASVKKIKNFNQNGHPEQVLPKGCNLVLLPNRELALSIDPGVELDAIQLSKLPSLIAEVQKQINVFATENILESQKVKLDEETVIHLSDDENPSMKDKAENNSNVNVASTTNASPRTEHLDSNNTMTEVGATTKEKKLIPSIDLNSLSSPKESCNIPGLATTTNSTIIDSEDVFVESSMNERTSKDNIKISEVVDNSTNNTEDALAVNKKTILSDLMEMSGISTDDISVSNNDENLASNDDSGFNNDGNYANNDGNVSNNDENLASNDGSVCHNDSAATNNKSISLLQQVLLQADSCTSDLQREYNNITRSIGVNPIMDNVFVRAALLRCPELNIISSFPELKYAYENGAQFFKMDVVNGIIVPINVCIKQDLEEVRKQLRKKVSKVPKSIIDLTEDNEIATYSSNFRPIAPKMFIQEPNELCEETSEGMIQPDKNNSPVKPIKMFKAVHPSILRYSGRSLLVRPVKNSTELQNKIVRLTKHKRKQGLCVKNIDVDEYNNFKPRDNPTNKIDSDAESDEEPLAKKAKRLKDHLERGTKNKNIDHSLYMDGDMNTKATATMDINHELPPRLEPIVFDDNTGQSSDDDCILGV